MEECSLVKAAASRNDLFILSEVNQEETQRIYHQTWGVKHKLMGNYNKILNHK